MDNKYRRHYHVNADGSAEVLCELLDCFEQPCYFQFTKLYDMNPWIFFCGNINLFFNIGGKIPFGVVTCETRKLYCDIQTLAINNEYSNKITSFLNTYGEIIVTTAFNYVSDYVWYKQGGNSLHIQHCTYIIGENNDYYYVVDNPYVLCNAEKIKWKDNSSIFNIPKSHFMVAFQKCCFVTKVEYKNVPKTEIEELKYFKAICKENCEEYDKKNRTGKVLVGKEALLFLKRELEKENEIVMQDFFLFHLIIARRIVFKRCFNIFKTHMYDIRKITSLLNNSIECWKIMKELAFEYCYYNKKHCMIAAKKMEEIIEVENALISAIANICWKSS